MDTAKIKRDNEILAKQVETLLEENKKLNCKKSFASGRKCQIQARVREFLRKGAVVFGIKLKLSVCKAKI